MGGQELTSSRGMQMKNSGFTKVVGENQDGIFVIHAKNTNLGSDFHLERFKHDLSSSSLFKVLIPKAHLGKVIIKKNSISYFTQEGKRFKGEKILRYTTIASSNYQKLSSNAIKITDYDFNQELTPSHTSENKRSTTFAIGVQKERISGVRVLQVKDDGTFVEKANILTEYKSTETKYLDVVYDTFGNTYILAKVRGKFVKAPQYLLIMHNGATGEVIQKKLNNENTWLSSVRLVYDSKNKVTNVFSFFGEGINENRGYMFLSFGGKDQLKKIAVFNEFTLGYKEQFMGVNSVSIGAQLNNFHVKGFKPTEDGGVIVVAEKFEKVDKTQIEFINGIAQPLTRSVYNFDEVMILSIDFDGEMIWNKKINKKQNTMYDGGFYSSIQVVFTEYSVHVIYNDKMNTSGNVMQYSIDLNGVVSDKIVLKSVNYYQYIIPMQGRQIGYNRAVIPATVNKDSKLIKFTFK
jgi:hypothetical protein